MGAIGRIHRGFANVLTRRSQTVGCSQMRRASDCERFPRRIRRGLIEARSFRLGLSRVMRFPRRIRRGLIEAQCLSVAQKYWPSFRGEFAAASLKLGRVCARRRGIGEFPRRIRRGLIEALRVIPTSKTVRQVSAANSPRPH